MTPDECPIFETVDEIGREIRRALRRLVAAGRNCPRCPFSAQCDVQNRIADALHEAAEEVLAELGA